MKRILLFILLFISGTINAQVNLNLGLVAYYPFNGNANDASGNGHNGTLINGASFTTDINGNPNSAAYFDGIDDFIEIIDNGGLLNRSAMSFSMQLRSQSPAVQCLLAKENFNTASSASFQVAMNYSLYPGGYFWVEKSNNSFCFFQSSLSASVVNTGPNLDPNTWYCLAGTYENDTIKIYLDGQLKMAQYNGTGLIDSCTNYPVRIGRWNEIGAAPFSGTMDEVRIYDRALNVEEINALSPCARAVACNNWLSTPTQGSYVTVGDLDVTGNQVTVEALVNRTDPLNNGLYYGHLISKHTGPANVNYALLPNGCEITTTTGYHSTFQNCQPDLNRIYHVAMVYDGTTLKFYRNGFLISQTPCTGNMINNDLLTTIAQVAGNGYPVNNQMLGYVNEVRIWNTARTQAELRTYMDVSLPSPATQPGLLGYYIFDDLLNKQGNAAYDGTLHGSAAINATNPNCNYIADSCPLINTACNTWLHAPSLGSYVTVGDLDVPGNQLTVEALINRVPPLNNGLYWGHIVSKHTGPADVNYALSLTGCEITTTTGYTHTEQACDPELDKVYHIAMVYDGSALKFYRNGFLMSQVPWSGNMIQNDLLTTIAQVAGNGYPLNNQFLGYVNEVRIWNVARTQAQLQTYMNTGLPGPTTQPGLLGYYVFDDLLNKQGNATYNGTLHGAASINATNPTCNFIADSCSIIATACDDWLSVQTQNSKIAIGDLDISGNQLTVETNYNRAQPLNSGLYGGHLVSKHTGPADDNYSLFPNGCAITTTTGYYEAFETCPFKLNKTYHVAMVYDGANLKFYRNGFLMSQTPCTGNLINNNTIATIGDFAGPHANNNQFLGYQNEVRIWNVARTQTELQTYMFSSLPSPSTQVGLQGYYVFDDLLNKQGNATYNGTSLGTTSVNSTNPNCTFVADSCPVIISTCDNWLKTPTQPSYVDIGNLGITGTKLTIEAEINRTSFYSNNTLTTADVVSKHSSPADANYALRSNHCLVTTTNGFFATPESCPLDSNKTYHIAMVYDGATLKYYRDGYMLSSIAASGNLIQNSLETYIGYLNTQNLDENFIGYINEVRIWNIDRTQAQLRAYMNTSLPNPSTQPNLLAYYIFNDLQNKQGNTAWDGTLGGSASINETNPNCAFVADSCLAPCPNIIPTFDPVASICSGAALAALPATSLNSINGTWSPALNNTATTTYTFTPTAGQCATTTTLTITVNANVVPTFNPVAAICSGAALAALPTTSLNGINGTWSPALNNTATTTYTFTPNAGQCATTATLTITVNAIVLPTFSPVAPICSGAALAALPTTSLNGINGTWSPALNNTATTTYTFTPNAGQCATITTLTITVNANVIPTFNPVAAICSGAALAALPTTSLNGINGTWSPALNNTATTTYTFTPTAGQCATTTTLTITVNANVLPSFNPVAPICSGAVLASLPTTSLNGINGTWSPALNNTATTTYTFTPNAGQCATTATLTITVNANVIPTFNPVAAICSGAVLAALPTTSLNGINGTWSPALNNTATTTYTFTPTAGQCATTATLTITVNANVVPTFNPVAAICSGAALAALPTTSLNGINGTWSPALNNTATTTYTFTPTAGQCATTTTLTITVNANVIPTFNPVAAICSGAVLAALPTTSLNGINGTWSPALNNTATTTYTFTPSAGPCATTTTLTITVNANVLPTFNPVAPICSGAALAALPTTSLNGINGTWSPALNNIATTTYTFTPTIGQCATTSTLTITVNANVIPTFNPVAAICSGTALTALPTTSLNGINGTWSPALNNTATTTYTFTATAGQCATTATLTITVNANVIPTFNPVAAICSGAALATLPTTSLNGINGTWSPALNNTATTIYTFTPNAGPCATPATLTITVNANVLPTFNPVAPICSGAALATLPATSLNGINGTWSPALDNTTTTTYTFTPNAGQCAIPTTLTIIVNNPNTLPTFNPVVPICSGAALAVLPTTSLNGINGTWSPAINNTATTTYTFTPTAGQCAIPTTLTITVNANVIPAFNPVAAICSGTVLTALPTTSLNGINGTWSPALNNTATTTYTFTPTAGQCATTATLTITVNGATIPAFDPVAAICSGTALAALPTTSLNGINGTWSPALNNTTTTTYTFTPTAGQCATTATLTITVNAHVIPAFNPVAPICSGAVLTPLPTTSLNGITGTWSPALNNTSITTYTFTPDAGQCANTTTLTITVFTNVVPTFNPVATICSGATLVPLPTTSLNGINGTWSPALNNTATTTYTFTPNAGQCGTTTTLTIAVNANVAPSFNSVAPICSGTVLTALPTTSLNGINGTWSPALNNTATTTYTFTPNAGQCATTATLTITVTSVVLMAPPNRSMCYGDTVQLDGNNGTAVQYWWFPPIYVNNNTIINPVAFPPTTTLFTVVVSDLACHVDSAFKVLVTVIPSPDINAGKSNDIDCAFHTATLHASGGDLYSWSPTTGLDDSNSSHPIASPAGTQLYTVLVTNASGCSSTDTVTVFYNLDASLAHYIPNAFTPNGDGKNDCFGLRTWMHVRKLQFMIFNRWGEKVFSTENVSECWDGNYKGKKADVGTYVYYVNAETDCGHEELKGTVILIR